jgi:hypothetical protein
MRPLPRWFWFNSKDQGFPFISQTIFSDMSIIVAGFASHLGLAFGPSMKWVKASGAAHKGKVVRGGGWAER